MTVELEDITLADLHCDTAYELYRQQLPLNNEYLHITLDKLKKYRNAVQVFAAWTDSKLKGAARKEQAVKIIENFREQIEKNAKDISLCGCYNDIEKAWQDGKVAALLAIEGGGAFDGCIENIEFFAKLGVRIVTITWNSANELAVGQPDVGGLTEFGKAALDECKRANIIVDVSHANEESFFDICAYYDGPVVASHSNMRAVCAHPRNLTEEQLRTIMDKKGLCGLNLYPSFVKSAQEVFLADILPHIERAIDMGAQGCLCLGCDFDGVSALPEDVFGVQSMGALYNLLLESGYSKTAVDAIFYKNAMDFLKMNLKEGTYR